MAGFNHCNAWNRRKKYSESHVNETANIISQISPDFFSFLTTVVIPGTPISRLLERGSFEQLSTRELFSEMKNIIEKTNPREDKNIIFRANHVSNMMPLAGILPRDRIKLVSIIESWIKQTPIDHFPKIDPHQM